MLPLAILLLPISILQMIFGGEGDQTVSMQLIEWAFDF